jgi:integrase/recombinase XerD
VLISTAVPPTLDQFTKYITHFRSLATAGRYTSTVQFFLTWVERNYGPVAVHTLPRDTLSRYAQALLVEGYATVTIQTRLAGISRYFRWLQERQNVTVPDFYRAELPQVRRKVRDILTPEAVKRYLDVGLRLEEPVRTAAMLLPCSGLRSQEMVSLKLTDIRRSPFTQGGQVKDTLCLIFAGKGGHERIVPLLDEGAVILLQYLQTWRRTDDDKVFLFPSRKTHLATRTLREAVQKIREALNMEFTPHTMRRTYLTTLYRKGVPITTLAKIAGHADAKTLVDHYLALDEHDVVGAVHATGGRLA